MFVKVDNTDVVKTWKQIILFLMILVACSLFNNLFSQNLQTKPSRQSSMEAYSRGNYEEAYREFKELLKVYSKDPLYKYYSGVCLIKLDRNPTEAESLLKEALQSASVVKSLPSDALFYLGRAQQKSGNFNEAIISFNQYTQQVGKKIAKEQNVPVFIQECNEKQGKTALEASPAKSDMIESETKPVSNVIVTKAAIDNANVNKNIPSSVDLILDEALILQSKADSLTALAENQKKQLENIPPAEINSSKARIAEIEVAAASYQKLADQKYSEAQAIMNPQKVTAVTTTAVVMSRQGALSDTVMQPAKKEIDSKSGISVNKQDKSLENKAVTEKAAATVIIKPVEVFSVFEILAKPVTDPKEKISIDPAIPDGLIFRIQVAVFRNPVAPVYFKGITPVYGFKIAGTDKTTYYTGMFRRSADASKALVAVKSKGFKDSFVVALLNGKAVSADRAAILEKEWGKSPLMVTMSGDQVTSADTIPPTLAFRVEVMRSLKPLKDDVVQEITKMAGNRGLDKQIIDGGQIAYLIGRFITFESAAEYADLLIRNGYKEAKVVAWIGKKEIPVETARELFDNLK